MAARDGCRLNEMLNGTSASSGVIAVPSAVYKYQVMWTGDVRKKHKTYNDGFLTFHTFNKLAILYNDQMVQVAREFFMAKSFFLIDENVQFERHTIEIEAQLETQYQDLSPLYDRPHHTTVVPGNLRRNSPAPIPSTSSNSSALTTPRRPNSTGHILHLGTPPTLHSHTAKRFSPRVQGPSLGPKKRRRNVIERAELQRREPPSPLASPTPPFLNRPHTSKITTPRNDNSSVMVYEREEPEFSERMVIERDAIDGNIPLGPPVTNLFNSEIRGLNVWSISDEEEKMGQKNNARCSSPSKSNENDPIALLDKELSLSHDSDLEVINRHSNKPEILSLSTDMEVDDSEEIISSDDDDLFIELETQLSKNAPLHCETKQSSKPVLANDISSPIQASSSSSFQFNQPAFKTFSNSRKPLLCLNKTQSSDSDSKQPKLPSRMKISSNLSDNEDHEQMRYITSIANEAKDMDNNSMLSPACSPKRNKINDIHEESLSNVSNTLMQSTSSVKSRETVLDDNNSNDSSNFLVEGDNDDCDSLKTTIFELELSQAIDEISLTQFQQSQVCEEINDEEGDELEISHTVLEPEKICHEALPPSILQNPVLTNTTNSLTRLPLPQTKRKYFRTTVMPPAKHPQYTPPVMLNLDNSNSSKNTIRTSNMTTTKSSKPADEANITSSTIRISHQGPWTDETLDLFSWRPKALISD